MIPPPAIPAPAKLASEAGSMDKNVVDNFPNPHKTAIKYVATALMPFYNTYASARTLCYRTAQAGVSKEISMIDIKVKAPAIEAREASNGSEAVPARAAREITVQYDMPADLDGLVKKFKKEVVANHAIAALKVAIQGVVRNALTAEPRKTDKEIQAEVAAYIPGVRARGKSPQEKIADGFAKLTPEQKRALLKQLGA